MITKPLKTIFLGTPDFSLSTLEMLHVHTLIDLVGVVTMPDRPAGRGKKIISPAVADFAKVKKIPLVQTPNVNRCEEFFNTYNGDNVDLIIVLAFAQFLGKKILSMPPLGCFNIHTSLLPKYRGAAPIQYALLNGDESTGVSIQKMVKQMDAGDICYSKDLDIAPYESGGQLYTRLKFAAALGLNEFIEDILAKKITYTKQNDDEVSFAPTISKEMGRIDFKKDSFKAIKNKIRAFDPWPGTFCFFNNKRLKVFSVLKLESSGEVGVVNVAENTLNIGMGDFSIRLTNVQLEGKKRCTDIELLNGLKNGSSEFIVS